MGHSLCGGCFSKRKSDSSDSSSSSHVQHDKDSQTKNEIKEKIKLPISEYTFTQLKNVCIQKEPNTLHDYPLVIEDCLKVTFYILDISSQITIDACKECIFILGPCEGSIFIRDVEDCTFILAVQYFLFSFIVYTHYKIDN